jgi:hypothetical protein
MALSEAEAVGIRFLNPTVEPDYGVHLFEYPQSHKIVRLTQPSKYHLRHMSLNLEYLIRKRPNRSHACDILPKLDLLPGLTRQQFDFEDSAFANP